VENLLQPLLKATDALECATIAPLDDWIASYIEPFPFTKGYEEAKDDPIIVLHSSGSTGNPKPITNTHAFFAATELPLPEVKGRTIGGIGLLDFDGGGFIYSPFPGYHLAGITALSYFSLWTRSAAIVLGPPDKAPSVDIVRNTSQVLWKRHILTLTGENHHAE
jgi:acyl-CoA synthetase (AMP-forming)/AMP-acid ligase II